MIDFSKLNIEDAFIEKLQNIHITIPSKVQQEVIPLLMQGKSLFFESETGTGKTFAFLLPLLHRYILHNKEDKQQPKIIILTPTVELAAQIKEEIQKLQLSQQKIRSLLCIGGASMKYQIEALKAKPHIIIGTPARIADLINLKKLKTNFVHAVVIDEADRLLSKELGKDLQRVITELSEASQWIACSATLKKKEREELLALINPNASAKIEFIQMEEEGVLKENIEHWALFSERRNKIDTLRSFIKAREPAKFLVFTSPAAQVENIVSKLNFKKLHATPLYSNLDGKERKKMLADFKADRIRILVTSDLAARGLDIPDIEYVIQMTLPADKDFFIHRAGRTGRAGKKGINLVIGDAYELKRLKHFEQELGLIIYPKVLRFGKVENPET
ncbi:DEAD/DEAH box helicase [Treponema phagedenis]|uniref:DEAD/DEAH box helicase n=1 Tax=Treponema phagedenis TaxID=162 RepID=A0A0B7GQG5_TREPH|nr:DEAD/DEAH box helicase [Treponema phagedenis]EFW39041.1 DEAD/DEAH box helicase [Treponema phagedenis F0421]NVP24539.1 DEAD/DEAH box helicase [Treponema phagedenis]QEJ94766.1 DEAD/DEAH box helicase [Treponema phagedenis]QEJ97703.1 DEAD/DEAH box helicase [Treponema phagedenis]QEK00672.1 DEAD/DEAH box helicase [Treponema phagedenis]